PPKDIHVARNSSLSLHAHHQSRAISSPSPNHTMASSLSIFTHIHARLSPASGSLAISAPGYSRRTQPVVPAPRTGTCPAQENQAGSSAHPHIRRRHTRTCTRRRRDGLRESRKERKSKYLEEEEERWKKGTGEKGVFERETRGMCVSKIFTEIRKEKKRKALRARWEDGREGKPGKSEERGGAEYALAPLFTPAEGGTRCGSRAGGGPSPP
ncbi:hypothetical protein B0H13DRAFT_2529349, partial [Mycena leptocephala]